MSVGEQLDFSGYRFPFQTPEEAGLQTQNTLFKSALQHDLETVGVTSIECPLTPDDFALVGTLLRDCIEYCPVQLGQTAHKVDRRFGADAGYARKERKVNRQTGKQIQDPKHLFHFNEHARDRWNTEFRIAPAVLKEFLAVGGEVQDILLQMGKTALEQLEETHPGIVDAHYPHNSHSVSYYRKILYDPYESTPDMNDLPVAKRHKDIADFTIQGFATASGFWGETPAGKQYFDSEAGKAHLFTGMGYEKIYGDQALLRAFKHGVDRMRAEPGTFVESREADILFLDAWKIDPRVTGDDTQY